MVPDTRGRTDQPSPDCPVEVALDAISGRWTTLVVRELMHGPRSFSQLRTRLPSLSAKILSERLHGLTGRGLAERTRTPGFPSHTAYRLTERGLALRPLLIALYDVGSELLTTAAPGRP
nr:helix-turn-helix domain-containing protein [Kibdelosporangium phytohabitans]